MTGQAARAGRAEIRAALGESRRLFWASALFSAFVNLLMLTGPLFMLQVYDRVLTSRSEATLVALISIVAFLFLAMGLLDHARARVLARIGARFQARLDERVLDASLSEGGGGAGLAELETMQRFASGPGPLAVFDAPWTPAFLFVLFAFHWLMGVLATVSGALLLFLALLNQTRTASLRRAAGDAAARAGQFVAQVQSAPETVRGLGMREAVRSRTVRMRTEALVQMIAASDRGGAFAAATRTLRLFLQSMMLGLGAWLVLLGEVTPGVMIAASILLGRALAPIDQAVGQWPGLQSALEARRSLSVLLSNVPPRTRPRTALPRPAARLEATCLTVGAPGAEVAGARGVSLLVSPGEAIGIFGASASGKSTLARGLAGIWPPVSGKVTLGAAALDQYGESGLARHVGYLPQDVTLFAGTVAENIARLETHPDPEALLLAARRAGAHEMILTLSGGYDFPVAAEGTGLSGGQRQRIALARAFYGDPVLVVLDEPDAHLDSSGVKALQRALEGVKARHGAAVIVSHQRRILAGCDRIYRMENGTAELLKTGARHGQAQVPVRKVAGPPATIRLVDPRCGTAEGEG